MTPSPWHNPAGRWSAGEGSGAEALQTDVMRFMAILALCLVAIFALVQTMPLHADPQARVTQMPFSTPTPVADPVVVQTPATEPVEIQALPAESELVVSLPEPARSESVPAMTVPLAKIQPETQLPGVPVASNKPKIPMPQQQIIRLPARNVTPPEPAPAKALPAAKALPSHPVLAQAPEVSPAPLRTPPAERVAPPASEPRPLSLRFATDEALLTLVRLNSVQLYALGGSGTSWRLWTRGSAVGFTESAAPPTLFEMTLASVPESVLQAYRRDAAGPVSGVRAFGVVLPASTRAELTAALDRGAQGTLLIDAHGHVQEQEG